MSDPVGSGEMSDPFGPMAACCCCRTFVIPAQPATWCQLVGKETMGLLCRGCIREGVAAWARFGREVVDREGPGGWERIDDAPLPDPDGYRKDADAVATMPPPPDAGGCA